MLDIDFCDGLGFELGAAFLGLLGDETHGGGDRSAPRHFFGSPEFIRLSVIVSGRLCVRRGWFRLFWLRRLWSRGGGPR